MPSLSILAGPNGAGKTTFYFHAIEQNYISADLPFINIDIIVKEKLGGYTDRNFQLAEEIYRNNVGSFIKDRKDFMIESNLARQSDYDWIKNMMRNGYNIILYFLYTQDLSICIDRVRKRVIEGGHDVPVSIIEHRYRNVLMYLKSKLQLFSAVYVIDNSYEEPVEMVTIINGKITMKKNDCPAWVNELLFIIERLESRK